MFCPEEVRGGKNKKKNNFSSSVGIEFVLFLNRKPQNIVVDYPQTVLAPLLLELVTQCPMCPAFSARKVSKQIVIL